MIIPLKDYKLTQFRKSGLDKKIFVLSRSSAKNSLSDINTHLVSYKMVLNTCAEKEYVLGFDMEEEKLGKFKANYNLYAASMCDVLEYCKNSRNSLIVMTGDKNRWVKIDPKGENMSLFYVQLTADS